ncbi:WAT1-related protein At5g40240 isoform X4 [Helianthus annuus]|uniref:WAT1-related protein At5g40240 isoform X4 n=2 Tax=Helianthus annuus TaxID=4232 RepID=UPI000B8F63B6|nr:WAT1-related protein At5g40240 isoform X4 [Helianthus annuus]
MQILTVSSRASLHLLYINMMMQYNCRLRGNARVSHYIKRVCLAQVLWNAGVDHVSPTMAIAISNLGPGITFLIAVFFRLEKLDTTISSVAKLLGTMISILGAMVFTLYQGPRMFHINSPNQLFLSQPSEWIYGSLIILVSLIFGCIWVVLQAATTIEYPDQQTIVFFFNLFGTIQCIALSPFVEQNRSAWVLRPETGVTAVVLGIDLFYLKAIYTTAVRCSVFTWCLRKKRPIFVAMFSPLSIVIAMIMGVTFLGDSLHLGSVIGTTIISFGFYTVIWGQTKEKNKLLAVTSEDLDVSGSESSADETLPLLSSRYQ